VFAFSSLWFAHYTLDALEQLRNKNNAVAQIMPESAAPELIANKPVPTPQSMPETSSPGAQP
jgi:hypothetical protein